MSTRVRFRAKAVRGMGRGKGLGTPTVNLLDADVPSDLAEGVYAAYAWIDDGSERLAATLHHGPRPVFGDPPATEVHVIDGALASAPERVEVEVVRRLRDIRHFPSVEALQEAIASDIEEARAILSA